jgi:hypothetical protein
MIRVVAILFCAQLASCGAPDKGRLRGNVTFQLATTDAEPQLIEGVAAADDWWATKEFPYSMGLELVHGEPTGNRIELADTARVECDGETDAKACTVVTGYPAIILVTFGRDGLGANTIAQELGYAILSAKGAAVFREAEPVSATHNLP